MRLFRFPVTYVVIGEDGSCLYFSYQAAFVAREMVGRDVEEAISLKSKC